MGQTDIDLKREQEATLARPRYPYSWLAKGLFRSMDMVAGNVTTLSKARLIEALASVPYRAWENREYARMTGRRRSESLVAQARQILTWAHAARDNEQWHYLVLREKMREEGQRAAWYLAPPAPQLIVAGYSLMSWALARVHIRRAFLLNAEFEDHAEHTYAELVRDHPEWDRQSVSSRLVAQYTDCETWGDVFRRIGLDERDHMNNSFRFVGMPSWVVQYDGMPAEPA